MKSRSAFLKESQIRAVKTHVYTSTWVCWYLFSGIVGRAVGWMVWDNLYWKSFTWTGSVLAWSLTLVTLLSLSSSDWGVCTCLSTIHKFLWHEQGGFAEVWQNVPKISCLLKGAYDLELLEISPTGKATIYNTCIEILEDLLPCAHAQGVKQSVLSVFVGTKIATSWDLSIWVTCKHNISIKIGQKNGFSFFDSFGTAHECHK